MNKIESIISKINRNIIGVEEMNRVASVLERGFLSRPSGGPEVKEFQLAIGKILNKKYAFAATSGTSALHLAIASLGLKDDDEVIIPALANIADFSVIIQEGARPVFADIDPETFNIDPCDLEKKITKKTKAIIVVHMYGQPVSLSKISKIAKKNKLILIEDCAQSAGARYHGKYVGSFGDISCFSFYQTKHIITGEGGMVLTSNRSFAKIIDSIANNGIKKEDVDAYDYDKIGYNYQMTELQAALGIVQLKKLDKLNIQRRKNVEIYKNQFKDLNFIFQKTEKFTENSYFYLTVLLPESLAAKRDQFLKNVQKKGVPIKKLYPLSLPELEIVKKTNNTECPVAKSITKRLFNLYVNPGLSKQDLISFSAVIKDIYIKLKNEKK
ncbi:MAG: DegT/DnrJ/EryC1/StrS family aminotransferase [Patescibacteria group bacterium]